MLLDSLAVDAQAFAARTGWEAKPEGLCRGDVCVPSPGAVRTDGRLDVTIVADRLRMPLVHDDAHGIWALGPSAGGRALTSADAPALTLPLVDGSGSWSLSSMRGRRTILVAWASW
jgi:hypothetical protein